jgi:DNA polymerase III epsilon subunit-like protein
MEALRYFIFDTETSDLLANSLKPLAQQPHIIELYGCIWDTENAQGEVRDGTYLPAPSSEIEFLCKPPIPMDEKAIATHHISEAMLADAPAFAHFAPEVQRAIETSDAVVAHNLSFDWQMVENEMRRCGRTVAWPIRRICTVENTEHINGYRMSLGRNKKGEPGLYHYLFGEDFPEAHRAKPDTLALLRCFVELLERGVL